MNQPQEVWPACAFDQVMDKVDLILQALLFLWVFDLVGVSCNCEFTVL